MTRWFVCLVCLLALSVGGCSGETSSGSGGVAGTGGAAGSGGGGTAPDYTAPGPLAVGVVTTSVTDAARSRTLPVEVWYPTSNPGAGSAVIDFEQDADRRSALSPLLDAAPSDCVPTTTASTRDAPAVAGDYPVVLYTHCYTCTRWSAHAVVERLASHGFVVVSADHEGDTLYDLLDETQSALTNALVDVREADVRALLDAVLGGDILPDGVAAVPSQVGVLGHSIGSVTAGRVAQNDSRIAAAIGLAAPMENVLIGEVFMANITIPVGLLEATEDNSVGEPGNVFIRENFSDANTPAYKLAIVDAGHWSVTNIAGLTEGFAPGCGEGTRQTNGDPFTYVPVADANGYTASFVTAFFAAHLLDDAAGLELLRSNPWPTAAPLDVRE